MPVSCLTLGEAVLQFAASRDPDLTHISCKCDDIYVYFSYSEEVFNQHSRKLSESSSGLENEDLVSEMYYAGGESSQHLTALTHICDSYPVEPSFK